MAIRLVHSSRPPMMSSFRMNDPEVHMGLAISFLNCVLNDLEQIFGPFSAAVAVYDVWNLKPSENGFCRISVIMSSYVLVRGNFMCLHFQLSQFCGVESDSVIHRFELSSNLINNLQVQPTQRFQRCPKQLKTRVSTHNAGATSAVVGLLPSVQNTIIERNLVLLLHQPLPTFGKCRPIIQEWSQKIVRTLCQEIITRE